LAPESEEMRNFRFCVQVISWSMDGVVGRVDSDLYIDDHQSSVRKSLHNSSPMRLWLKLT
jgi:hypothetical protein